MYRRQPTDRHQLVIPKTLVEKVIKENHNPVFVAHPGVKRTCDLISLNYWWPAMRRSVEDYVRRCDLCQRRKGDKTFVAPLGEVEEPTAPFQVTSMDITGPYPLTPRKNRFLLTFIDNFTRYVEAYLIPDQRAVTYARVYATQIIARHGTGSKLVTDQGWSFMSQFFSETCKILGVRQVRTTPYHPSSNGVVERWHRSLHTGLNHYINSTNTNWDVVVPFYLMAYRATPNTATGYSPFFLLHGREMVLPNSSDLKAKISKKDPSHVQRLESLRSSLKRAYKSVAQNNRISHLKNKRLYDRKAKLRSFEVGELVYLYVPATKPGLSRKFHKCWTGPCKVTAKLSDLNYEATDQSNRKQIVHVNRLKAAYNLEAWRPKGKGRPTKRVTKTLRTPKMEQNENEVEVRLGPYPLCNPSQPEGNSEQTPLDPSLDTPEAVRTPMDTPDSERNDPSYDPPATPRSRRELQTVRADPPVTRSRTRILSQEPIADE